MATIRRSILLLLVLCQPLAAQSLPAGWASADVGAVGAAGHAAASDGTITVRGAGDDIWNTADAFHFAYVPLTGDGAVIARVASLQRTHHWAKAGVMMRETLAAGSKHASMLVSPERGLAFQRRVLTSGISTSTSGLLEAAPHWVRLARSGDMFTAQTSDDGISWRTVGVERIAMAASIHVGLAVTSHSYGVTATAQFDAVSVEAGVEGGVTLARQPYLQQVTATSATIVWTTFDQQAGEVSYRQPGGSAAAVASTSTRYPASTTGMPYDFYQHEVRLWSLSPGTTYEYEVRVGGIPAFDGRDRLTTAPAVGTGTVRFIAFGDSGTGSAEQRRLAALMDEDTFDIAIHTGDVVYGSSSGVGDATFRTINDWFFLVYERWLRRAATFPALGNHDSRASTQHGFAYLETFVLRENAAGGAYPDHAERYYSFDYGPVHFVALDTELAFSETARRAEQVAWLEADLAATTQPWKVVYFHRTPYTAGAHHGSDLEVRAALSPVFEEHGVQLVLAAHEHLYERTHPLPPDRPAGERVVYVTTGGGGAPVYPAGSNDGTAHIASAHHYVRGAATECSLTLEAVGLTGAVFDDVTLERCGETDPTPDPLEGWAAQDIGSVGLAGSATEAGGTITLRGSGADIWNAADAFQFVSQPLNGDGEIIARVASLEGTHHWAKAGVMIRETLDAGARHAFMLVSRDRGLALQYRSSTNGVSGNVEGGAGSAPQWVRLVRSGNTFRAYRSPDGANWTLVGSRSISMGTAAHVGLALTSHDNTSLATAAFDQVHIVRGASTWSSQDIGNTGRAGSASEQGGVFTIEGAGADIWNTADAFHFVSQPLNGDGEIVARVASLEGSHHWAKAGVMIRETLDAGSRHAFMLVSRDRGIALQYRSSTNGVSANVEGGSGSAPQWVRLVRTGNTFRAYRSSDGANWTLVGSQSISMGSTVYVGLAVTSHAYGVTATASFDAVGGR